MLGLIPDWQFSADPAVNPMANPHVSMPAGMYQSGTVQPVYGPNNTFALAGTRIDRSPPLCWKSDMSGLGPCRGGGLGYVMIDERPSWDKGTAWSQSLGFVESWAWRNRKGIVLGALGIAALSAVGLASMLR